MVPITNNGAICAFSMNLLRSSGVTPTKDSTHVLSNSGINRGPAWRLLWQKSNVLIIRLSEYLLNKYATFPRNNICGI